MSGGAEYKAAAGERRLGHLRRQPDRDERRQSSGTTIGSGGTQTILSTGSAVGAVVSHGTQTWAAAGALSEPHQVRWPAVRPQHRRRQRQHDRRWRQPDGIGRRHRRHDLVSGSVGGERHGQRQPGQRAGSEVVYGGGLDSASTIGGGGGQTISAGGSATGDLVSGGTQTVLAGGSALADTVVAGGAEHVSGLDSGNTVGAGGDQHLDGGTASTTLVSGALAGQHINSGGVRHVPEIGARVFVDSGGGELAGTPPEQRDRDPVRRQRLTRTSPAF